MDTQKKVQLIDSASDLDDFFYAEVKTEQYRFVFECNRDNDGIGLHQVLDEDGEVLWEDMEPDGDYDADGKNFELPRGFADPLEINGKTYSEAVKIAEVEYDRYKAAQQE